MSYPANLDTIVVRHKIVDTGGKPMKGNSVRAVATKRIWATDGSLIPFETTARVQADGTYEFELPYVDQDGIHNKGVPFQIIEDVPGGSKPFFVAPVLAHGPGPIDATEALVEAPVGYNVTIHAGPVTDESMAQFANDTDSQFHTAVASIIAEDPDVAENAAIRAVSVAADPAIAAALGTPDSDSAFAATQATARGLGLSIPNTPLWGYTELQAAANQAAANGTRLWAVGTITTDQTLTIACDADLGGLTINYTGTGVAVRIGTTGKPAVNELIATLPHVRAANKTGLGWSTVAGTVGVEIVNLAASTITIPRVARFETGVRETANSTGNVHNTFILGHLQNNKVNWHITAADGGWTNQNLHLNGRFSHESAEGVNITGVRQILLDDVTTTPHKVNNHTFINTSIEGAVAEYTADIGGENNLFLNCRWEVDGGARVRWAPQANRNQILYGYNAHLIQQTYATGASTRNQVMTADNVRWVSQTLQNPGSDTLPLEYLLAPAMQNPATQYSVQRTAKMTKMKRPGDTFDRMQLDHDNARINFGTAAAEPDKSIGVAGSALRLAGWQTTTSATAGAASPLPAAPSGYLSVFIDGAVRKIPYFDA